MATVFEYTISSEDVFPNKKVDVPRFIAEIQASSITVAIASVVIAGGNCVVTFKNDLTSGEVLTLDLLVKAHSGVPLSSPAQPVVVYAGGVPAPVASDGKPFSLPNIFPGEVLLNFAGCSDVIGDRFGGDLFGLQQVGAGDAAQTLVFNDGIFLAGGHVEWDGGAWGSHVYMELVAPPSTTKAPAVAGKGNCNKVLVAPNVHMIIPAPGNGAYDLDVATPIPAYDDESMVLSGYWNNSEPWIGKGVTTPGSPGSSKYNLFDIPLELAHFCKLHLFRSTGIRDLIAPAIKPKWILPEWSIKVFIHNSDANSTLRLTWDLMIARRKSV